jgi:hypothetical protein
MASETRESSWSTDGGWAVLELMGHRRLGGFLQEVEIAGCPFLRIDVPAEPPVTQFYSSTSVYCITPTTEEIARALGERTRPEPVSRYELLPAHRPANATPPADDLDF